MGCKSLSDTLNSPRRLHSRGEERKALSERDSSHGGRAKASGGVQRARGTGSDRGGARGSGRDEARENDRGGGRGSDGEEGCESGSDDHRGAGCDGDGKFGAEGWTPCHHPAQGVSADITEVMRQLLR